MAMWSRARRAERDQRGAASVEFALIMLPLLYLVFGAVQYGFYFWGMQAGTSATSDAVRRLSVGDCQDSAELRQFLHTRLGAATTTNVAAIGTTITYKDADGTAAGSASVGGSVTLTANYDAVDMDFPFIPLPSDGAVSRTVFGRVEDTVPIVGGCS